MNAMDSTMRLALLLSLVVGCVNAACPPGFVASITVPGKCYYLSTGDYEFFSAINYCRNNLTYGADILAIANGFENSEVASLLQSRGISYGAWVGNAFYDNKSHWIATAAGNSNYSNWGSSTYNGYAAFIYPNGGWNYTEVDRHYGIICQIYPDDPTTFPPPQTTCPAGWTPSISVKGKCYLNIGKADFFSATKRCLTTRIGDSHAELVTITSQLEMMELFWTQLDDLWASLTSWEADGHWHWIETRNPTDYFGPSGLPLNSGGACAFLTSYDLYETTCWKPNTVICQYFPDESPAPTPPSLNCPQNGIASLTKPGTCYYFLDQYQTFQNAQSACQALNTGFTHNDLFVPRTLVEYEEFEAIVFNPFSPPSVWLGLTSSNDTWSWIPGRSSNITSIWCGGDPDTSPNDQCGFIDPPYHLYSGQICWTAGDCTGPYAAVCQSSNTF